MILALCGAATLAAACTVDTGGLGGTPDGGGTDASHVDASLADVPALVDVGPECGSGSGCDAGSGCDGVTCDDGLYCNGIETCRSGACDPGESPCAPDRVCDEGDDSCVECLSDRDCPEAITGDWSSCRGFSTDCDETGEATRDVTDHRCIGETCQELTGTERMSCTRDIDGDGCESDSRSCTRDVCDDGDCTHPCRSDCNCAACMCW